jgi:hypothetical protein
MPRASVCSRQRALVNGYCGEMGGWEDWYRTPFRQTVAGIDVFVHGAPQHAARAAARTGSTWSGVTETQTSTKASVHV